MPDPLVYPDATPRHALPFLFPGQAQKEMSVNEALSRLDLLVHTSVIEERADPPLAPQPGQCWLVGSSASGAWAGAEGQLAGWVGETWQFVMPTPGMVVWNAATSTRLFYDGGWRAPATPPAPSGGTMIDTEARAALAALIESLADAGILTPP